MLTEINFKRCYVNGNFAGVSTLEDGRAVLFFNGSWLASDGIRDEFQAAGVPCHSFGSGCVISSADLAGINSVVPGAVVDWENSPEYLARRAAAKGSRSAGASAPAVSTSDAFQVPGVDSVAALATVLGLLPPSVADDVKAWGVSVGAAVLDGSECPAVPESCSPLLVMPSFPPALDCYKLTIQAAAKDYAEKIEKGKDLCVSNQNSKLRTPLVKRYQLTTQYEKVNFYLKRLEDLNSKINNFTKEDEDYYYNEFLKLNALRLANLSEDCYRDNEHERISYCKEIKDSYIGIRNELGCFHCYEWGDPYLFRLSKLRDVHPQCSCIYFSRQILNYYITFIKNKMFEEIYTDDITSTSNNCVILSNMNIDSLVENGIPYIINREINFISYLGCVYFYCNGDNIDEIICNNINRIASNISNFKSGGYKGFIKSELVRVERIESEALPLFAYSKKLLQNEQYKSKIEERNIDYESYKSGSRESILSFLRLVLEDSSYPFSFDKEIRVDFSEKDTLVVEYQLPTLTDVPDLYYKELKRSNDWVKLPTSKLNSCYDDIICAIALRTIGEIFTFDSSHHITSIGFNGFVKMHNPATGIVEKKCLLSLLVNRETFSSLDLKHIEPKQCVKYLKGVFASKIHSYTAIQPIISINSDSRIVANKYVEYSSLTNLAEMDWEDFEHLVRQIFEWEFKDSGGEVNVTQASRDGGVDAIIFDPDPIRGGKIVVQAKRYTNTVGVSAVRDLYGTIINEGANKGILITTSDYGPDAYKFATGKPITLLNGGHLLYLLEKHGKKARIDLKEAKENLGNLSVH